MKKVIFILVTALLLPACMSNRINIGNYHETKKTEKTKTYTYDKVKQCYLFWGLVPLGRPQPEMPASGNFQVRTYYNFWDALVSGLTGGIFSMRTVKIKALKANQKKDKPTEESTKTEKENK